MPGDNATRGAPVSSPGEGDAAKDKLRVLMTPDFRSDNPYQALLAGALEDEGVSVSFPQGYRRVLPLRRMLRQGAWPDVMHLHWLAPYLKGRTAATKAVYAAKLVADLAFVRHAGVRLTWTVHNLVEHEQAHPRLEMWCRRQIARLADAIIVHNERARQLVRESYSAPTERIYVIPHGHYRDVYGAPVPALEARAKLDLPQEGSVFLFFGMIRPYKGIRSLLAAWAATPELHDRHTLVIAGEVRNDAYWGPLAELAERSRNVRLFLGRVPDNRVATFHSAADVVVLPFECALTSGSLVLAQSFGKRVVRPDLESLEADDGETAITYPARGGSAALARALLESLRDDRPSTLSGVRLIGWPAVAHEHRRVYG